VFTRELKIGMRREGEGERERERERRRDTYIYRGP
jgi:hypothetical protein